MICEASPLLPHKFSGRGAQAGGSATRAYYLTVATLNYRSSITNRAEIFCVSVFPSWTPKHTLFPVQCQKQQREAGHSFLSSIEVSSALSFTATSPHALMSWYLGTEGFHWNQRERESHQLCSYRASGTRKEVPALKRFLDAWSWKGATNTSDIATCDGDPKLKRDPKSYSAR
jgi:hypothetical protein